VTATTALALIGGVVLALIILWDAVETILVPRRIGRRVRLARYFYLFTWRGWRALALDIRKPARREALLGVYGPLSLLLLIVCWAAGLIVAFALLQWAALHAAGTATGGLGRMFYLSGETFFTLGFGDVTPATRAGRLLSVLEAGMGFGFLGTVIGYLPTMYAAFAQREIEISLLDARAGTPPTAAEFLHRLGATGGSGARFGANAAGPGAAEPGAEILRGWERWAAQLLETHISYPQLAYYRSQHGNQSWLGALTAILDATAILIARAGDEPPPQARLTFAIARHAMVDITQIFVPRWPRDANERLGAAELAALRAHLVGGPLSLPDGEGFETRLAALRQLYEPYALALSAYLLFELPPWIRGAPRRDNWRGGPWDREIAAVPGHAPAAEEHF